MKGQSTAADKGSNVSRGYYLLVVVAVALVAIGWLAMTWKNPPSEQAADKAPTTTEAPDPSSTADSSPDITVPEAVEAGEITSGSIPPRDRTTPSTTTGAVAREDPEPEKEQPKTRTTPSTTAGAVAQEDPGPPEREAPKTGTTPSTTAGAVAQEDPGPPEGEAPETSTSAAPKEDKEGHGPDPEIVLDPDSLSAERITIAPVESGSGAATRQVFPSDGPETTKPPPEPDPTDRAEPPSDPTHTWRDGDETEAVWLVPDLTVGGDGAIAPVESGEAGADQGDDGFGIRDSGGDGDDLPVFRSGSGALMTLPGGVLLSLDPEWSQAETDGFFSANGIARHRVSERDWALNAFFIETDPGFPSLNLANHLAGQEGVEFSIPNWWMELTTK